MAERHKHHVYVEADQEISLNIIDGGDGFGFRLFNAIVDTGTWAQLSPSAAKVLVALARNVNDQARQKKGDGIAWPSIPTIARLAGTKERVTYYAIDELERVGLLTKRAGGGGAKSTTYQLLEPGGGNAHAPHPCTHVHPKKNERRRSNNSSISTAPTRARSSAPKPSRGAPAPAAGSDVQAIEQTMATQKIGNPRRQVLARQAADAGLSPGQVADVLDKAAEFGAGPGLRIRRVEDLIDAAHASRDRAQARVQVDAERIQAEAAGVLTGAERQAALERGKRIIADRLQ